MAVSGIRWIQHIPAPRGLDTSGPSGIPRFLGTSGASGIPRFLGHNVARKHSCRGRSPRSCLCPFARGVHGRTPYAPPCWSLQGLFEDLTTGTPLPPQKKTGAAAALCACEGDLSAPIKRSTRSPESHFAIKLQKHGGVLIKKIGATR